MTTTSTLTRALTAALASAALLAGCSAALMFARVPVTVMSVLLAALPWSKLTYNERLDGYEVNVTEDELRAEMHAHDIRDLSEIARASVESEGEITFITRSGGHGQPRRRSRA